MGGQTKLKARQKEAEPSIAEQVKDIRANQCARVLAFVEAADLKFAKGDLEGAEELYRKAVAHPEWRAFGWLRPGASEADRHRAGESPEDFGSRKYLIPHAYTRIAEIVEKEGIPAQAQRVREKLQNSVAEIDAFKEAMKMKKAGDYELAREFLDSALTHNPSSSQARLELVRLDNLQGKTSAAALELDSLIGHDPQCVEAFALKIAISSKTGEPAEVRSAEKQVSNLFRREHLKPIEIEAA